MDGQLIDSKQEVSTWDNYKITFDSYQDYLEKKGGCKRDLNFIDLLYASNYKGGSGSIQEDLFKPENKAKLNLYSALLKEIDESFKDTDLRNVDASGLVKLTNYADRMITLCSECHIKGLGVPYCSALFHLQFPNLFPVIDRNVLLGIGDIIKMDNIQKSGQIWKIERHYISLIGKLYDYVQKHEKSLRDADKDLFDKGKVTYEEYKQQNKP